MTELEQILSNHATRRDLDLYFAGLIRAHDFAGLEAELRAQMAENPSSFTRICHAARREKVSISGWDELHADIAQQERGGRHVTAVGIDLTGHNDGAEPGFEVSLYDDSAFAFSTASDADLFAASEGWSTPWQGCFLECEHALECAGLADLHGAVVGYPDRYTNVGNELPVEYAGFVLAGWWLHLRIHQGIVDALARHGLPRAMPVAVGEHDFSPYVVAFYRAPALDRSAATDRILDARANRNREWFDRTTEQFVAELREKRIALRGWPWWRNRKERRNAFAMLEAHEKLMLEGIDRAPYRSTAEMPDSAFDALLNRFRDKRRPGSGSERVRADPGEARSELHFLFLKHARHFGGVSVGPGEHRRAA